MPKLPPCPAASQWWSNERMMVYFKLMMVKGSLMLVNDGEMGVWSYTNFTIIYDDFIIINKHFTIITSTLPSFAWSKSSFAHWEAAPTGSGWSIYSLYFKLLRNKMPSGARQIVELDTLSDSTMMAHLS